MEETLITVTISQLAIAVLAGMTIALIILLGFCLKRINDKYKAAQDTIDSTVSAIKSRLYTEGYGDLATHCDNLDILFATFLGIVNVETTKLAYFRTMCAKTGMFERSSKAGELNELQDWYEKLEEEEEGTDNNETAKEN